MMQFAAPVTMATAGGALAEGAAALAAGDTTLSLVNMAGSDSSLLAVLVDLSRQAQVAGKTLRVIDVPPSVASFAKLYGIDVLLPDLASGALALH